MLPPSDADTLPLPGNVSGNGSAAGSEADRVTRTPHFTITAAGELRGEDSPANRDLARRIRACVNACEGLPTADLEAGIVARMRQTIAEVVPVLRERVREGIAA